MARRQIGHGGHARFACRATVAFPEPRRRRDRSLTSPCTSQSRPVDRPLPRATAPVGLHCQPSRLRSHPRPLRATPPRGRPEPRSRRRARAVNETIVAPMRPQGKIKLASTPIRLASPLIEVTRMGISSFQLPESRLTNRPPQYCPRTPVGGILHAKHALGDHVACNGLGRMEPMSGTARSAAARTHRFGRSHHPAFDGRHSRTGPRRVLARASQPCHAARRHRAGTRRAVQRGPDRSLREGEAIVLSGAAPAHSTS